MSDQSHILKELQHHKDRRSHRDFEKPRVHGEDVFKGFILSSPLLIVAIPMLTLFFAWWLIPIFLVAYVALTYQMTIEMSLSRFLQKNRQWLQSLLPTDLKIRKEALKPFLLEAGLTLACVAIGLWVTLTFASGIGGIAAVYPLCHIVARLNSFSERHLSGHILSEKILTDTQRFPLTRIGIPAGIALGLLLIGGLTPPGLIGAGAVMGALMVFVFAASVFMTLHNQHRMKASLSAVADHAQHLCDDHEREKAKPRSAAILKNEKRPATLLTLREALQCQPEDDEIVEKEEMVFESTAAYHGKSLRR